MLWTFERTKHSIIYLDPHFVKLKLSFSKRIMKRNKQKSNSREKKNKKQRKARALNPWSHLPYTARWLWSFLQIQYWVHFTQIEMSMRTPILGNEFCRRRIKENVTLLSRYVFRNHNYFLILTMTGFLIYMQTYWKFFGLNKKPCQHNLKMFFSSFIQVLGSCWSMVFYTIGVIIVQLRSRTGDLFQKLLFLLLATNFYNDLGSW